MERGRVGTLWAVVVALVLLAGAQWLMAERDGRATWRGKLFCPDSYMRMVRVRELVATGAWYDDLSRRSNTPFGERLHWTRPLDALIVAGAAASRPFVGERALDFAGVFVGPALHVLALLALVWAFAPLLDSAGRLWLGACFPFQLVLSYQFAAGRPDHHGLISLALIASVGFALRLIESARTTAFAALAAFPVALGLWVSVESLLSAAIVILALGLAWLASGEPFARRSLAFSFSLAVLLTLALMCEHPASRWLEVHYDSLSVVHVAAFWTLAGFWGLVAAGAGNLSSVRSRIVFGTLGALVAIAGLQWTFPGLLAGPVGQMDSRLLDLWFRHVRELRPILNRDDLSASAGMFLMNLGGLVVALPWLFRLVTSSPGLARQQWWIVAMGLALTLPLSLHQLRWSAHCQVFLLPVLGAMLAALMARMRSYALVPRFVLQASAVGMLVFGVNATGSVLLAAQPGSISKADCDWVAMARHLDATYATPKRIATFIFRGPEILYGSRHEVVAGPYHRNASGMLDLITLFSTTHDEEAEAIIRRRSLDLVLIAPDDAEAPDYRHEPGPPTSLMRLENGPLPPWIEPVDLPPDLGKCFRLFTVRPASPVSRDS
jgi:hypothetical protein